MAEGKRTIMNSQSIGIDSNGEFSRLPCSPSQEMLSKSLGNYSGAPAVSRRVSEVSTISYAGYLMKRSNRSYKTVSPFPGFKDYNGDFNAYIAPNSTEAEAFQDSFDVPHSPLHYFDPPQLPDIKSPKESPKEVPKQSPKQSPKEAPKEIPSKTAVATQPSRNATALEQSFQFAASFFGIELSPVPDNRAPPVKPSTFMDHIRQLSPRAAPQPTPPTPPPKRSAPIKMVPSKGDMQQQQAAKSASSAEKWTEPPKNHRCVSDVQQPVDFIDPKDRHIWRAKYCVLEDGVLYFYRHQADADSFAAKQERLTYQPPVSTAAVRNNHPLGYSPIPVRATASPNDDSEAFSCEYMWEKRVALDCVGAVRSAELEYGKNSFELLAVDEDSEDKLVLRAQNADEMNEWLFQFHRSIATFVRDIMDHMTPLLGEPRHPASARPLIERSPERYSAEFFLASPRNQTRLASPSLSHGHGRNSMHRRRIAECGQKTHTVASSVPNAALFPFTMRQGARRRADESAMPTGLQTITPSLILPSVVDSNASPELSGPQAACPETEHPVPSTKYVPPHLRNRNSQQKYVIPQAMQTQQKYVPPPFRKQTLSPPKEKYIPRHMRKFNQSSNGVGMTLEERAARALREESVEERASRMNEEPQRILDSPIKEQSVFAFDNEQVVEEAEELFGEIKLGGCADPELIKGSILDENYIPRKASKVGKTHAKPFGCTSTSSGLRWELGAVSECGVREANEDAYVVVRDIRAAFMQNGFQDDTVWNNFDHASPVFAIFDGHCGNHAARFASEKLMHFIYKESGDIGDLEHKDHSDLVGEIIERTIASLDDEFCTLCVEEERDWESGATAVVATLVNRSLVVSNLGDARAVLSRSVARAEDAEALNASGWHEIPFDEHLGSRRCFWQDVTEAHSPDREDERARIEGANGWVTTEKEIPIGQFKRMDLYDQDVVDILKRCFADRYQPSPKAAAPQRILHISRVCGELAVSRAIGDRDFKAIYHSSIQLSQIQGQANEKTWNSSLCLPYPEDHSGSFVGDLVINKPDFQSYRIGEDGVVDEFLLMACDGLWDVIDSDDAIRVTRDLLFEKGWPAKKAAARLAELAVHLGSSDNITVVVVRFFDQDQQNKIDSRPSSGRN